MLWLPIFLIAQFVIVLCTVMPLSGITVALFPVWKWDGGQVLFNAEEIQSASYNAENCSRGDALLCLMKV